MLRRLIISLILMLTVAGIAAAQVSVVPSLQYQVNSVKMSGGYGTLSTSHKGFRLGVDADFGNGLRAAATYIAVGGGAIVYGGGIEEETDTNQVSDLRLSVMYLFQFDEFAVGPVLDYTSWSWTLEIEPDKLVYSTESLGFGVYAAADFDKFRGSLSYIHRFDETLTDEIGILPAEKGTGNRLAVDVTVPLGSSFALAGGYEIVTHISTEDGKLTSSGWRFGASYSF